MDSVGRDVMDWGWVGWVRIECGRMGEVVWWAGWCGMEVSGVGSGRLGEVGSYVGVGCDAVGWTEWADGLVGVRWSGVRCSV